MTPTLSIRESVIDYCAKIGADSMLVQGAGGNVSWKDGDTLWVKASGTWLADAKTKEIFVPVDLADLRTAIDAGNFAAVPKLKCASHLRPSIETMLHALMPQRVVVHVHAVEALAYLVRANAALEISDKLQSLSSWSQVGYQKPGEALASAVAEKLKDAPGTQMLLLENHGLVIGGADVENVSDQLTKLLSLLACPQANPQPVSSAPTPQTLDIGQEFSPFDIPGIHKLAVEPYLFDRVNNDWALYPDHVVFLGHKAHCYESILVFKQDLINKVKPELVFIKDHGVFAKSGFSIAKIAQLQCYFDVIIRQPVNIQLKTLTDDDIAQLLDWDAERYRQNIAA